MAMDADIIELNIQSDTDVAIAVKKARKFLTSLGFVRSTSFLVATAISELTRNALIHAGGGIFKLQRSRGQNDEDGIVVTVSDFGPGIADIDRAFETGYSTSNSLGLGLPGVRRIMDDVTISSHDEKGCIVTAHKWK